MIEVFITKYFGATSYDVLLLALSLYVVWLPILLVTLLWQLYVRYKQTLFLSTQNPVLLEIKLPKEVTKSPAAMEIFLNYLSQTRGEATFYDRNFSGKLRPWFSLELVSFGGEVHLYIWGWEFWRNIVEAQLYAQYPGVEIHEAKDYTRNVTFNRDAVNLWGCDFVLTMADPYPIRTYVDYGLDKDPKEEFKIDPMTAVLEFLGSVGKGHQVWIQILVRSHKKDARKAGTWFIKTDKWVDDAKAEVEKIRKESIIQTDDENKFKFPNPTKGQQETIAALERSVSKTPFECGIRAIYITDKKDDFNPLYISGIISSWKQYGSQNLNSFKPTRYSAIFNYPWQDFRDFRANGAKRRVLDAYKRRSYFVSPYTTPYFILNSEELATVFHIPGQVAATPTLAKIQSRKAEAPGNLPT